MKKQGLLDTGPLVASFDRRDQHHEWAADQMSAVDLPLITCEPVLTEATHLLRKLQGASQGVIELVRRRIVTIAFDLDQEVLSVARLLARYANIPMSLADACLVRMAEQHADGVVLTLDRDFRVYRKHGRQVIPTIMPPDISRYRR